jgi:hypothetical protein
MHPQTHAKELWRMQASDNIDSHETLCAIDELVTESVRQASINWRQDNHLVDFSEYQAL